MNGSLLAGEHLPLSLVISAFCAAANLLTEVRCKRFLNILSFSMLSVKTPLNLMDSRIILCLPFIGSIPQRCFFLHKIPCKLYLILQSFWFCFYNFIFIFFKHPEICIASHCRIPLGLRSVRSAGFKHVNPFSPASAGKSAHMTPGWSLEELPVLFLLTPFPRKSRWFGLGRCNKIN